ncbi:IS3 family transposase [Pseudoxanthomonas sacheonensis]|nr:IS3 family transposase [Pseudoxanthomonas sacheonensis]
MANRLYTAKQIHAAVQAMDEGIPAVTVAARIKCHPGSVRGWRRRYSGLSLSEVQQAMAASAELEQLRRKTTRYEAERAAWKHIMRRLAPPLSRRIELFGQLQAAGLVSINQAKAMLCMASPHVSLVKYERDDTVILRTMKEHLAAFPGHGFETMFHQVLAGKVCGIGRAQRIYAGAGLQLYRRNARRPKGKYRLAVAPHSNFTWSIDFMHFRLVSGAPARTLNVLDDFSRECLLIKGGFGTSASLVAEQLAELVGRRGLPSTIRCDNGPEFTGRAFLQWAAAAGITIEHIAPYRAYQNAYIERFNRTVRDNLILWNSFTSLDDFDRVAEDFRYHYNHCRPHESLGWTTPAGYAAANAHC